MSHFLAAMDEMTHARFLMAMAVLLGCDDAIVLELGSPLRIPEELDSICVSVAALDSSGDEGTFSHRYQVQSLPQTLTVLPGGHSSVQIWARGSLMGMDVARAGVRAEFSGVSRIPLQLAPCTVAPTSPKVRGRAPVSGAPMVLAVGWREPLIMALGAGKAVRVAPADGLIVREGGTPDISSAVSAAVAVDLDGDCDDDLVVAPTGHSPQIWQQDGDGVFAAHALDDQGAPAQALIAGDIDGDGDPDVVLGGPGLRLYRNDGIGQFFLDGSAFRYAAESVTALALGDFTGDRHLDLVVAESGETAADGGPLRLLANDPSGSGRFERMTGALPELPQLVRALAVADLDRDGDYDLVVAGSEQPLRLYINRGKGRLEDQTVARLSPVTNVGAVTVSAGDFDGNCRVDVVVGRSDGEVLYLRGSDSGSFEMAHLPEAMGGQHVLLEDLEGDGARDLLVGDIDEVTWVAPGVRR